MKKIDPEDDPKTYFHHIAMDLLSGFTNEDLRCDSVVDPTAILGFGGVCEISLRDWPCPLLIAFWRAMDSEEKEGQLAGMEQKLKARQRKMGKQLRRGLVRIGLEELGCQDFLPREYAIVTQLEQSKPGLTLPKAAHQLSKLVWDMAE
jgi:hypothetical protein